MSDWLREQANDEREAQEEAETAYREMLRFEAQNAVLLSALKAADASMTLGWTDPSHADARRELGTEMCEIWIQIRSAISQAQTPSRS